MEWMMTGGFSHGCADYGGKSSGVWGDWFVAASTFESGCGDYPEEKGNEG